MYRRDFLKIGGVLSAAVFVPVGSLAKRLSLPVEVEAHGKLFRGTPDGKIYVSRDAGKNWQLHTNFGSDFSIEGLSVNFWGQVRAQLSFANYSFDLLLAQSGNTWKTR